MTDRLAADAPHLPTPAQIEAYGDGGFRFTTVLVARISID